ncbi:type II secretion system protein [Candidatus Saccharibacteria bacterium]|nr:type II secretion system protein [Candidatus Saccharibacteria bacterium]
MNIHKHKSQSNNKTNNNNQLTPELNHHLIPSRNSRSLAQALPTKNKRWNSSSQKPAFTIIEVVLVLAIAGLIFLMVFIALPALQRNQRDTQRKNDMSRLKTAIDSYKANNRGKVPNTSIIGHGSMPFSTTELGVNYLKAGEGEFKDPNGEEYLARAANTRAVGFKVSSDFSNSVFITFSKKCGSDGALVEADGTNNYAIQYVLEGGGTYCLDG